jgi:membrane protein DedA with SNARE-associated domain
MADSFERSPPTNPPSIESQWTRFLRMGYALWLVATLGVLGYLTGWQFDRQAGGYSGRIVSSLVGVAAGLVLAASLKRRAGSSRP